MTENTEQVPAVPPKTVVWWPLAVVGALVVVLSFFASYWGASVAASGVADEPPKVEQTAPVDEPEDEADEQAVLPAGADVRVGHGVPDAAYGTEGDVFIDIDSADVFVRTADGWTRAGNLRTSALESLTGEQGEQGEQGQPGAQGEAGKPGAPGASGTQVVLGTGSPDPGEDCGAEGDVFIDTAELRFYECTDGAWAPTAR